MKTSLLLAFSFALALAPVAGAWEDQDAVKAAKNRAQAANKMQAAANRANAQQAARRANANVRPPRTAVQGTRIQGNLPAARVQPAPRWQPPQVNQDSPRVNPGTARVRNDWQRNRVPNRDFQPRVRPPVTPQALPDANVQSGTVVTPRTRPDDAGRGGRTGNNDWNRDGRNRGDGTRDGRDRGDWNRDGRNRGDGNRSGGDRDWRSGGSYNGNWTEARRRRHRGHHHRSWWTSRYNRIALFGGGYYYWDNGFWFPAYGYDPYYSTYSYDEPIYGYGDLDPGQVVANVQTELQRLGYYRYEVDGLMGPLTRNALAAFQRDNGLPITSAIDGPTLSTLGLR